MFYAITLASGLSAEERRRAIRDGNEHVGADPGYENLMTQAGFVNIEIVDVTDSYRVAMEAWANAWAADSDALMTLLGHQEYELRKELREVDIAAVRDKLLMRYRVSGVKA
jgi:hypothetical protein